MSPTAFQELRVRVEAYEFDRQGDVRCFRDRLCGELGWSALRADRAIAEYRRFVAIAAAVDHAVSPSPDVDQVWHQHLTDTRRYWEDFCPKIFGRVFHHEPSRGGEAERRRLDDQYQATLAAYERLFGEPPPRSVWPAPGRGCSVWGRLSRLARRPFILAPVLLALVGCAAIVDSASPSGVQGQSFILLYVLGAALLLMIMAFVQRAVAAMSGPNALYPADLELYEIAYLAGGPRRVVQTALLSLQLAGLARFDANEKRAVAVGLPDETASPVDAAVHRAVRSRELRRGSSYNPSFPAIRHRLGELGFVPGERWRRVAWVIFALVVVPVMALGLVRLGFGINNHRPTGFLLMALVAIPIAGVWITRAGFRPRMGGALRSRTEDALPRMAAPDDPLLLRSVAFWGVDVALATEFAGYRQFAESVQLNGGGASGSGGACGGGDGGCSGCGG